MKTLSSFIGLCIVSTVLLVAGCSDSDSDVFSGSWDYDDGASSTWAEPSYPEDNPSGGDRYESVGTNPFVDTRHDPFSTFAADVDSASYDIFRRDINMGSLPNPASVRLEEYVNYFTYDYRAPDDEAEHPFHISLSAAPNILGTGTHLLRVGIQGKMPETSEKKPANLVFLIDTSGSMTNENKLPLVQRLLTNALQVLEPGDKISIVTYAGSTGVRLPATDVANRDRIAEEINSLSAAGSTAGASGIKLAYEQARKGFIEGGINQVILCTDGDFNVGPSSDEELVTLIEEKRKTGVMLAVLGFGYGNLNDSMMEKISNAGNGVYAVISTTSQADDFVESRLLSNLEFIAKDMKIQVELNPELISAYRLLGYENRAVADDDFRNNAVDGGEIGAGHQVTALYEVVLTGEEVPQPEGAPEITSGEPVEGQREIAPEDMILVKVRYKDVDADEQDAAYEVKQSLSPSDVASRIDDGDKDFLWAAAIAAFAEILKGSPFADEESLDKIKEIVTSKSWLDKDRAEFAELFDKAVKRLQAMSRS